MFGCTEVLPQSCLFRPLANYQVSTSWQMEAVLQTSCKCFTDILRPFGKRQGVLGRIFVYNLCRSQKFLKN
jgi:hypothetical protein